jgi:two-component system LytT family response regulator
VDWKRSPHLAAASLLTQHGTAEEGEPGGDVTTLMILEHDALAQQRLEAALQRVAPEVVIAGARASVREAQQWFAEHPAPDLVVAEIQLADGLSFELFEQASLVCPVVFCADDDEHLAQAMAAGGLDYLLRPVKDDELARAFGRYRRLQAHFLGRRRRLARKAGEPRRILARRRDGFAALGLEQVAYFVVDERQADVVTSDGHRFSVDQTLAELESSLDPARFFRVNRQYLVAASAIDGFRPFVKGKLLVELSPAPADHVIVSQENAAKFRAWLCG